MEATTAKTSTTATKASKTVWLGAPAAATSADRKDGAHTSLTKSSLASSSTSQGGTPGASKPKKSVYLAADPGEESCKPKMTQVAGLTDWNAGGTATSLCSTALTLILTLTLTSTLALTLTRWHRHQPVLDCAGSGGITRLVASGSLTSQRSVQPSGQPAGAPSAQGVALRCLLAEGPRRWHDALAGAF